MLKKSVCEFESRVVAFVKFGAAAEETSAHLENCADCRETARGVSFFQTNLEKEFARPRLPAAGLIWWKSRLREKQRRAEQSIQPLFIVQSIAAVSFGAMLVWMLGSDWFESLGINRLLDSVERIFLPAFALTAGFLLISVILIFGLRRYLLEKQ